MAEKSWHEWQHVAAVKKDAAPNEEIVYRWHWPKGTFDKRMSALEIAMFVMPHMPFIVPLLSDSPNIQAQFRAMLVRLATWPAEALDELTTWIKPRIGIGDDDLIELNIKSKEPQPTGTLFFLPGAK
jgi:hypothetical protein